MKLCTKCGETKPTNEFHKNVSRRDGLQSYCKACININNANYRAANPGKFRDAVDKWAAANQDKVRAISAKWRDANPEKCRAWVKAWQKANPESRRIYGQNRRARKRGVGGTLSKGLAAKLFTLQRGKCACCKTPLGDKYHRDHVIPLALDGQNEDWNMQLLCAPCNLQKGAKHPVDFMQQLGLLL